MIDNDFLVEGVDGIGRAIFDSTYEPKKHRRRVYYLLKNRLLPARKLGGEKSEGSLKCTLR